MELLEFVRAHISLDIQKSTSIYNSRNHWQIDLTRIVDKHALAMKRWTAGTAFNSLRRNLLQSKFA